MRHRVTEVEDALVVYFRSCVGGGNCNSGENYIGLSIVLDVYDWILTLFLKEKHKHMA